MVPWKKILFLSPMAVFSLLMQTKNLKSEKETEIRTDHQHLLEIILQETENANKEIESVTENENENEKEKEKGIEEKEIEADQIAIAVTIETENVKENKKETKEDTLMMKMNMMMKDFEKIGNKANPVRRISLLVPFLC